MKKKVSSTNIPKESIYKSFISKIDFQDSYSIKLSNPEISIETIYLNIFNHTPKWIDNLLNFRNKIVSIFGLKTGLGGQKISFEKDIIVNNKIGIFIIYATTNTEIIAGEVDKHLNFVVSVLKQQNQVFVSTFVKYNNLFGKIYMTLIMPFHKLVVKSMLKNAIKNGRISSVYNKD